MLAAVCIAAAYWLVLPRLGTPGPPRNLAGITGDPVRGKYLATAAGCVTCHTDLKGKGALFAGGPPLKTPFGIFYGPNITPDRSNGIGGWTLESFARAVVSGVSPDGQHYFPSFPYTSYAALRSQDIADLKSYLDTVSPDAKPSRPHDVNWPFSERRLLGGWKFLFFKETAFHENKQETAAWNRGAYLVEVAGHCGECHTQRNGLGGKTGLPQAGNARGPAGSKVPGIRNLGQRSPPWSHDQLILSLQVGMKPSGDFMGDAMAEVVEHSTSKLTQEDQASIATYLLKPRQ